MEEQLSVTTHLAFQHETRCKQACLPNPNPNPNPNPWAGLRSRERRKCAISGRGGVQMAEPDREGVQMAKRGRLSAEGGLTRQPFGINELPHLCRHFSFSHHTHSTTAAATTTFLIVLNHFENDSTNRSNDCDDNKDSNDLTNTVKTRKKPLFC